MLYVGSCTPLLTDDYLYVLTYTAGEDFGHLITNIQEWWDTSYALFLHMNARLANPLASLGLFLFGRGGFTVLNTLFLVLSLLCLQRLFFKNCGGWAYVITAAAFLGIIPCPEGALLWADASANYLWSTTFFVLLLFPLCALLSGEKIPAPLLCITYLCSFFCAWMHEALGAPISAALFFTFLASKQARNKHIFALTCTFGMGVLPIVCTPAAWHRAAESTAGFFLNLSYSFMGFLSFSLFPILITLAIGCFVWQRKKYSLTRFPRFCPVDLFFIFLFLGGVLVSMAVGRVGHDGRGYYFLDLAVLLILLRLLSTIVSELPKLGKVIAALAAVVLALASVQLIEAANFAQYAHATAYKQALEGNRICVVNSAYANPRIRAWLPTMSPRSIWFPHGGKFGHVEPYYVITNEFIKDKSIYEHFNDCSEQEPQVLYSENLTIIRIPKDFYCDASRLKATEQESGHEAVFLPSHSFFSQNWIIAKLKGKTVSTFGVDYHEGFHYLILFHQKGAPLEIEIPTIHETTYKDREFILSV